MGKHYTIEFKLQVIQPILKGKMSIREAARFYNISSDTLVGTWLKRFEKSGIKGLISRKPSGRPPMKPKYAKMPPPPKTEEERLRLRILQLEAEVAYLKGSDFRTKPSNGNYPKVKNALSLNMAIEFRTFSA